MLYGVRELKRMLEDRGIKVFVRGIVLFTNRDARLHIERDPKPVRVCHIADIEHCFRSAQNRVLTERKIQDIEQALRQYCAETGRSS